MTPAPSPSATQSTNPHSTPSPSPSATQSLLATESGPEDDIGVPGDGPGAMGGDEPTAFIEPHPTATGTGKPGGSMRTVIVGASAAVLGGTTALWIFKPTWLGRVLKLVGKGRL
jgi:hypothetical protein